MFILWFACRQWGLHSTFLPLKLSKHVPHLIHIADYAFIKPDYPGIIKVWTGEYDWSKQHAIHLYQRSFCVFIAMMIGISLFTRPPMVYVTRPLMVYGKSISLSLCVYVYVFIVFLSDNRSPLDRSVSNLV